MKNNLILGGTSHLMAMLELYKHELRHELTLTLTPTLTLTLTPTPTLSPTSTPTLTLTLTLTLTSTAGPPAAHGAAPRGGASIAAGQPRCSFSGSTPWR